MNTHFDVIDMSVLVAIALLGLMARYHGFGRWWNR